jgi:hypothetical protein
VLLVTGTDLGDLVLKEQGQELTVLTLGGIAISGLEWVSGAYAFISADSAGMIALWAKSE